MKPSSEPARLRWPSRPQRSRREARILRAGTIAEWTITILLLLFLTTTLVQAFVIPTGSMEDTLLIGDHLLVDKLAFAPSGPVSKYLLPYSDVKRGDIIVFRYPVDIRQTFVKRGIGVPGDRIRIVNKQVYLNGVKLERAVQVSQDPITSIPIATISRASPMSMVDRRRQDMLAEPRGERRSGGAARIPIFAMGDNRDSSLDSRYWGFVPRENIIGKPLIIYWSYDAPTDQLDTVHRDQRSSTFRGSGPEFLHQDPLAPDVHADPRLPQ